MSTKPTGTSVIIESDPRYNALTKVWVNGHEVFISRYAIEHGAGEAATVTLTLLPDHLEVRTPPEAETRR